MVEIESAAERIPARVINETIRYTSFTAFKKTAAIDPISGGLQDLVASWEAQGISLRGAYDVSTLRADADLMLWLHADSAEDLQRAVREFRANGFGRGFDPVFSAMGLHRPAEFNKSHVPAFMSGAEPRDWLCFYPFVRSYEWYLLPDEERKQMLLEHGMAGRPFKGILSNTVSSFALGDYEWLLALESNDLHEIVDMMRELRNTGARRHVREETPFYTGRLVAIENLGEHFA
ncbi:MAG: hypothetical protein RJA35_1483 [Actinomycetota bacterium]|jgi:chlorite dismutase